MFHVKQGAKVTKNRGRRVGRYGRNRRWRHALAVILAALLLPGGLLGWMYMNASVVRVRPAEVYLPDLPAAFDGTTVLYVSDVNIRSAADAEACARLMEKLEQLAPDLLLLGGDYSARSPLDAINGVEGNEEECAAGFLRTLVNFRAPMGKFAIFGEADDPDALADALTMAGVGMLRDGGARVERGGAQLVIAGLRDVSEDATPYDQVARGFRSNECVIVLAHNPLAYTRIRMAEAQGGGAWADLVLSGHTLGGQIKLFGRTLRPFSEGEKRRIAGWYYGDDLPALVSQGLGCRGAKLRLGTRSEVWFLTLRRPEFQGVEG